MIHATRSYIKDDDEEKRRGTNRSSGERADRFLLAAGRSGVLTLLLGLVADNWISAAVIVQPALAVWFFPAGFAALAVIAPPQARNLAVGFTIPFG